MKPLVVLRPEPGNAATAARIATAGGIAIRLPLFVVRPTAWIAPDPGEHDALFLTSANALRHGGAQLASLTALPVHAVGRATATAASQAGFRVASVGENDGRALAAAAQGMGVRRALHLAGRDRAAEELAGVSRTITVYASDPVSIMPNQLACLHGAVALIHSPRAGALLDTLIEERDATAIAAISAAAAAAAGTGWAQLSVAATPDDNAVIAAGLTLAG